MTPRLCAGLVRKCAHDQLGGPAGLHGVEPAAAARSPPPVGDVLEPDGGTLPGVEHAREGHQLVVVDVAVGERDERLASAAVVPAEAAAGQAQRAADVEDALEVRQALLGLLLVRGQLLVAGGPLEEAGRRQLLLVARDDQLLPPVDGADGVVGADLRRLVEDDQVEAEVVRVQVGADRQRAHHQAGLQPGQQGRHAGEELAQRQVAPLLVDLAQEDAQLGRSGHFERGRARPGGVVQERLPDPAGGAGDRGPVQLPEPLDQPLVPLRREPPQRVVPAVRPVQPGAVEPDEERVAGLLDLQPAIEQLVQDRAESRPKTAPAKFVETHPFPDQVRIPHPLRDPRGRLGDRCLPDPNPGRDLLFRVE